MYFCESQSEARRLAALYKLNLLDTAPSEAFDRITRMAARIFGLPIAAISLTDIDRQWFKSRVGVDHCSIPRERAPCACVADTGAVLVVPDLLQHGDFRDSPLAASGIRFYAGAPLNTKDGNCLGALCVLGHEPREVGADESAALADLAAMVMAQIELQHAFGRIDPLSALPNRNQFIEDFKDLQIDRPQGEQRLAVLINLATPQQLAHAARAMGASYLDELITDAARWIRTQAGPDFRIYHVATVQFALLAPAGLALEPYLTLLENQLKRALRLARSRYVATPAVGVAPFEIGRCDCLAVLREAQSAAHDAIDSPHHVAVYSALEDALYQRRFSLVNDFGRALGSHAQLRLVFQPRVDIASGACVGAEALLRWNHPVLGPVGPAEFIPVVERSCLAQATTAWVLAAGMRQQQAWRRAGLTLQLSINVSAANLSEPDFVERLLAGLRQHDLPPGCIELEITESALIEQPAKARVTLEAIAATGVRLAIDDFGTGYSSLSYLQSMPADVVKIDQSFVRGVHADSRKQVLVTSMSSLSRELGYRVVAEGVECSEELAFLRAAGCDEAQGYLIARPLEAEAFSQWVHAHARPPEHEQCMAVA
jgi:EAL domain-containing protein (putative c-di-GMP-specific phosphodiesterase class I)/GGDEF domain-containing protein